MIAVNNISGIYVKYGTRKNLRKSRGKSENTEKGNNFCYFENHSCIHGILCPYNTQPNAYLVLVIYEAVLN